MAANQPMTCMPCASKGLCGGKGKQTLTDGLWTNNPIAMQILGICSALAVTNRLENSLVMGAALGVFSTLAYWLLPCVAFILLVLYPLFPRVVKSEITCPLVADGLLVITGIIAVLWKTI